MTKYANQCGYTDVEPFEVINERTATKLVIRGMNAELDPTWKPEFYPGGFVGHTANNREQRWLITPNPEAPTRDIRKHKNGRWYDRYGNRYNVEDQPRKFYDYNF